MHAMGGNLRGASTGNSHSTLEGLSREGEKLVDTQEETCNSRDGRNQFWRRCGTGNLVHGRNNSAHASACGKTPELEIRSAGEVTDNTGVFQEKRRE